MVREKDNYYHKTIPINKQSLYMEDEESHNQRVRRPQ